jgi:DNA-binding protein H-NS
MQDNKKPIKIHNDLNRILQNARFRVFRIPINPELPSSEHSMARTNYASQKTRLEKEKAKIEKQLETLQAKQRKPVITSIVRSMRDYGITPEEIAAAFDRKAAPRASGATRKAASGAKRVIPPKYRHPETQAEWTGRGKPPRWVSEAEAAGVSRDTFLIDKAA